MLISSDALMSLLVFIFHFLFLSCKDVSNYPLFLLNSKLVPFFKRCTALPFLFAPHSQQLNLTWIIIAIHNFFHEVSSDFYALVYIKVWLDSSVHVTIFYQPFLIKDSSIVCNKLNMYRLGSIPFNLVLIIGIRN